MRLTSLISSRRRAVAVTLAVAAPVVASATALGATDADAAPAAASGRYIVQVAGAPIASYTGSESGLPATKPAKGQKVDRDSAASKAYAGHLRGKQSALLKSVGSSEAAVTRSYDMAFNGFAATLTPAQVGELSKSPEVLQVWKDETRTADTVSTPKFLGLDGPTGVWQKQFGGVDKAGAGMIIGDIDSGIWPENPSFAATAQSASEVATIRSKWKGSCDAGTSGTPVQCNNKLIGARYYADNATVESFEFKSPRDYNGHGSHTASTAAGNHGVKASINGAEVGDVSGMAPQARIAAYKALWATPSGSASGSTSDLVQAIDDAVGDGVDIITYSISGSRDYVVTADELAFLGAADANVFVATSAGNEGDSVGTSSVAHNSPWTMTVAASTHDRGVTKTVTLGNGQKYTGVGVLGGVGPAGLVTSASVAAAGVPAAAAELCFSDVDQDTSNGVQPALDPAKAAGKIVVCKRGTNARTDKSAAVKVAGGVGMVLYNAAAGQSQDADFHSVPSIHVDNVAGAAVLAYASTAGATATISAVDPTPVRAPAMAGFSSYGPAKAGGGDLLKPDITAPGSGIIAAVSPAGNHGNSFDSYSGTSMSTPHIAGIAALVRQAHPSWSPAAVKSALMTNATPLDRTGAPIQRAGKDATPLDYGSGHVQPAPSFNPGLVYDAGLNDWLQYACGIGQLQLVSEKGTCDKVGSIDPSDLNYPSIAVGDLAGTQTITRTVTNVEDRASQYTARVVAPAGFTASVSPSTLVIPPGQSRQFKVTLTRTSAPFGQYAFGSLTWKGSRGQEVRSPIAVRPVAAAVTAETVQSSTSGSVTLPVRPGYTGTLGASAVGLTAGAVNVVPTTTSTNGTVQVTVPAGTKVVRFATYDTDVPAGTDVDLAVTKDGKTVGSSGGGTAEEAVTLNNPAAGTYTVTADLFSGPASLDVKVNAFVVPDAAAGNLTVTPASQQVTIGQQTTVSAAWSGLTAGTHYLGAVGYSDGSAEVGRTLVTVNP
ncbi:S8 family peptidase [Luteipulveratus flavus]|uniref:S8 family peptidase n=1 Tax=Luteipulveratus flavus TaxID=3031728 RepID=A0ABT6C9X6_9MICO|nr:S8 family peptidase [Luteipulveratus sp. YIM 133296]MDF8265700.1 S8 family peptidase [Luteipulveratus sp. YIM 133296]